MVASAHPYFDAVTPLRDGARPMQLTSAERAALYRVQRMKEARLEPATGADDEGADFSDLRTRLHAETAQIERPFSVQKRAELALATELAKRVLTRHLLAPRTGMAVAAQSEDGDQPEQAPIQLASLEEDGSDGDVIVLELLPARPDVPETASDPAPKPVLLEGEADDTNDAVVMEEEPTVADLLPEISLVPTRRPGGVPSRSVRTRNSGSALAYARAEEPEDDDNGIFSDLKKVFNSGKSGLPGRGSGIAVYDIASATVYMPDGTKLEAHSGIGHMKDNPDYTDHRMVGPTPPNIYNLRMREARFHGVEAIRMLPTDHAAMKGRNGILAHTYMLRGTNGSNGCVVFKNYNRFLTAFKAGRVNKMIVVPDLSHLQTYMASL